MVKNKEMNKTLFGLSKYLVFEISRELSLKETLRLGGVCKELHRKIHVSFGEKPGRKYICLKKTGEKIKTDKSMLVSFYDCEKKNKFKTSKDYQRILNMFLIKKLDKESSIYVIEILLKAGADVNHKTSYGFTPLKASINSWENNPKVTKLLLDYGADPNYQNIDGHTDLMRATCEKSIDLVQLLLMYGADPNFRQNNSRNTALVMACQKNHTEIAELLLEGAKNKKGADPNIRCGRDRTALIVATLRSNQEAVEILLKYGADINIKDDQGYTALDEAIDRHRDDGVLHLLYEKQTEMQNKKIKKLESQIQILQDALKNK